MRCNKLIGAWLCLGWLSVPGAWAGDYICSVAESDAGYADADFAKNPAFPTKKAYVQNQLDTVLAMAKEVLAKAPAYRSQVDSKTKEPTTTHIACTVDAAGEEVLDAIMPLAPTRQAKVDLLLFAQLRRVRDRAQRNQKSQILQDAYACLDNGQAYTISRDSQTQALQGVCQ